MSASEGVLVAMWPVQPIALQRVWCLFEIMTAINLKKDLDYKFLEQDADMLYGESAEQITVCVENSTATFPGDIELILGLIKSSVGVTHMNEVVTASIRSHVSAQVSSRDPYPACFDGEGLVKMADGTHVKVRDVQKRATVLTHLNEAAVVTLITRDDIAAGVLEMCPLQGLWLTPEHPVLCADGVWRKPCDLCTPEWHTIDQVYNFELERGHGSVMINDLACITLGQEIGFEPEADKVYGWGWWAAGNMVRQSYLLQTEIEIEAAA